MASLHNRAGNLLRRLSHATHIKVITNFKLKNIIYSCLGCKHHYHDNKRTRSLNKPNMTLVFLWAWSGETAGALAGDIQQLCCWTRSKT